MPAFSNVVRHLSGSALVVLPAVALAQEPVLLPPSSITTETDQVGAVRGYQALTSDSATRTATPLREIPQSITVLPRRLLEEQGSRTLDEALRNVPGVIPESPLFFNTNLNTLVRGFQAEIFRDGLQSYFDAGLGQSLLGIERVEVIKGPTSGLFGGGQGGGLGGAVNLISSRPLFSNRYEGGVTFGPYGYRNAYVDMNQVVGTIARDGTQVAVRLQAEDLTTRSYIENVQIRGYQVLPGFTVRNDRTSLTFQGFFSERRANDYPGLPPQLTGGNTRFGFDRFRNANGGDTPKTVTQRNGARVLLEHRIDDVFTARVAGQIAVSNLEQPAQFQFGQFEGTQFARFNGYLQQDLSQATLLPTLEARFTTGPVKHVALAGIELDQTRDEGGIAFRFADIYDFTAPRNTPFIRPPRASPTRNRYSTVAAFVQEQATFWDRVHLLGALRVTDLNIRSEQPNLDFSDGATRWTPRVGLGVDILPGITPFVGWAQGIRAPSGFGVFTSTPLRPEESEQWEVGVKTDLGGGISGSVAYFDIERRNVLIFDPVSFGQRQTGRQRSRGVEVEALWQPTPSLSVLGTYAHTVAKTEEDPDIAAGTPIRLVPRNAGRVWTAYRFVEAGSEWLRGLTVGAGVTAVAGAPADVRNEVRTTGYTIFDAQVSYDSGPLRVALTGRNLGDRRYTIPFSYFNEAVAPGAPAEVYLSASLRF